MNVPADMGLPDDGTDFMQVKPRRRERHFRTFRRRQSITVESACPAKIQGNIAQRYPLDMSADSRAQGTNRYPVAVDGSGDPVLCRYMPTQDLFPAGRHINPNIKQCLWP